MLIAIVFSKEVIGQTKRIESDMGVLDYDALNAIFRNPKADSLKIKTLQLYLSQSKSRSDTLGMANTYFFLGYLVTKTKLQYADSLIELTKDKKYRNYPSKGYLLKGNTQYEFGNYKEALELYLIASEAAKNNNNEYLYRSIKFNIGLLKNNLGEGKEAQTIFLEHLNFLDQNPKFKNPSDYNRALFALADSYVAHLELDLAKIYIDKGIKETLRTNDISMYPQFVVRSGIYHYHAKNYRSAIDSLKKGKKLKEKKSGEKIRIAVCDYYIALSYDGYGDIEKSIEHFKNVDQTLKETEDIVPLLLKTYTHLITYYKSKNDVEQQLHYINTLLKLDSIRDSNQIYLTKNIIKRYDTVELISDKEELIAQLQEDQSLKKETIIILVTSLIAVLLIAIYGYRRGYVHKKRFLKLLDKAAQQDHNISGTPVVKKVSVDTISQETQDHLLDKLKEFEEKELYLKPNINSKDLAKKFGSNSSYLSLVVNTYKQKSISQYVSDLRIDYVVKKLQTDPKLRKYTIKAIAQEIGFNTSEVFAKAFYKRTGIYPSYFIKKLEKQTDSVDVN